MEESMMACHNLEREVEIRDFVSRSMAGLSPKQQIILKRRFGIGYRAMTLKEIGDVLGVTSVRVRQIEQTALSRIRRRMGRLPNPLHA
jgi:RNA polymerase sigma factor (sigma-70 family)